MTSISADDIIIVCEYDLNGNRILMDDESGVYAYTYDARDRLLTVTKDDTDYLSYEYDIVGNLSKMYAGASLHSSYTYDANNRVTKVNDITYAYDANGNLASITTDAGTTAYEYNKNNAVTKVTNTLTDETVISMYSYTYYANGNQATKTDKNNVVTTYVYDRADRLIKVSKADLVRDYTYDNAGNRERVTETYPLLTESSVNTETVGDRTIEFDSRDVHYLYTKANVLTTATEVYTNGGVETGKKITRHTFDKAGNEISTSVEYVLPYVEAAEEPSEEASEEVSEEATDEIGLTSVAENDSYGAKEYDLAIEVTINEYNALNQLVGMSKIKDGKRSSAEYVYDGDGLRISKTINDDIWKNTRSVGSTWTYIYSGKTVVGMTDGTSEIAAMYIGAFGCQQIDYASGESEYNFTNAHGDVTNSVKVDGTILNTFDYDEFGNLTTCEENQVSYLQMAHFRYAGEYYDIETGNYYLKARYYNPSTGRFTQADTFLGYSDNVLSLNRYTYCHNNPIMFVDPSGHMSYSIYGAKVTFDENQIGNHENMILGERMIAVQQGYQPLDYFLQYAREIGLYVDIEFEEEFYNNNTSSDAQDFHHETIYDLSRSSDYKDVQLAEQYLYNSVNYSSNNENLTSNFIRYYVYRNGGIGKGNENVYQIIYGADIGSNRNGEADSEISMYEDYQFSVFDALGWMILTGGNINFVLQARSTSDVKESIRVQNNILTRFYEAITLINNTGTYNVKDPSFYVGTLEKGEANTGSFADQVDIYKTLKESEYGYLITGAYIGVEDANKDNIKEYVDKVKEFDEDAKLVWIPYFISSEGLNNIMKIADLNIIDTIIIQPSCFYYEVNTAASYERFADLLEKISTFNNNSNNKVTKIGIEFEFDMGLVTGRTHISEGKTIRSTTPELKKERFLVYMKEICAKMSMDTFKNMPIGIYSGGPNEQGMRNIFANKNIHNYGNHLAYVGDIIQDSDGNLIDYSNKEYENYPQTYNHVAYSEFPGAYANNLIYDITYEILNGTYNVETGTWNNSNLNDFFPEEEIVKND